MWIEVLILGILLGFLRGGKLSNLDDTSIKGGMLIVLAIFVQLAPILLSGVDFVNRHANYFGIAGLALAMLVILLNIRKNAMRIVLVGVALNALVFYFHNFKMPVNLSDAATANLAEMKLSITNGAIGNYMLFSDTSHWSRFLGKIFVLPSYYPLTRFVGFPDILVAVGLIWVIQDEMQNKPASYGSGRYGSYYNRF